MSDIHFTEKRSRRPKGTLPRIDCRHVACDVPGVVGPCHEWVLSTRNGYGQVAFRGTMVRVHRYVWERDVGPIPEGMVIDHKCRNRACCNVDHLRVVTPKVNATENTVGMYWQLQREKTHCKHGHLFDEANTRHKSNGRRECRSCDRARVNRNYRLKKRTE